MSHWFYCDPNLEPLNYRKWMTPQQAERFRRLGDGETLWKLNEQNHPILIVLHLFANDSTELTKWLDIIYEIAAPDSFGSKIEFFVDDLWAGHIFQWDNYEFRNAIFSMQSAPLIYGVSATGKVHFFGNTIGPHTPSPKTLGTFCNQLLADSLVSPYRFDDKVPVPEIDLENFNDHVYGQDKDVVICFYNSQNQGMPETDDFLRVLEKLAAKMQQERIKIFKMNVSGGHYPIKKFDIQSTPTMFILPQDRPSSPVRFLDNCKGIFAVIKFVAQHASEELLFYDRRGDPKVHFDLLSHIHNSFN